MTKPLKHWSDEEKRKFALLYCVHGEDQIDIAEELGKSSSAMSRAASQIGIRGHKGDVERYIELYGDDVSPLLKPVRVNIDPVEGSSRSKTSITSLHWGDIHFPFEDERAVNILYQITEDLQPDELYASGDILDFWQISSHRPPSNDDLKPEDIELQNQVEQTSKHAATMIDLADPDYAEWRMGNHEDRFARLLMEAQSNPRMRHLLHLPRVREALDLTYILGLDEQGWEVRDYESPATNVRDKLMLIHGNRTNKWFTRSLLNKYGVSVMTFHAHKFQNYTRRDFRGQEAGFGIGCLCSLDAFYDQFSDWHQGLAVVEWNKSPSQGWLFDVNQVRIHDGEAIFRGNHYTA